MLLLASGTGIAQDSITIVFAAILIGLVIFMFVAMRKQGGETDAQTPPEEIAATAEETKVIYVASTVSVISEERTEETEPEEDEETEENAEPEEDVETEASDEDTETADVETDVAAVGIYQGRTRIKKSFSAKLIQSGEETKEWYSQLKNAFLSYKKTTARLSWQADSINSGRTKLGKFVIRGKTLCLYLALDPDEYAETKYRVERATEKRYEEVPCLYKIKGMRRAKYALDLIAAVAEKNALVAIEREEADYRPPYEETQSLVDRGLIRIG